MSEPSSPKRRGRIGRIWVECPKQHVNLRATLRETGDKCPQCGSRKFHYVVSPEFGVRVIGRAAQQRGGRKAK